MRARRRAVSRTAMRTRRKLGADRWASLVAARRREMARGAAPRPAIVVNAGTAVTIDALDADGVFRGGLIVPGIHLMLQSLADNTAAPARDAGGVPGFSDEHARRAALGRAAGGVRRDRADARQARTRRGRGACATSRAVARRRLHRSCRRRSSAWIIWCSKACWSSRRSRVSPAPRGPSLHVARRRRSPPDSRYDAPRRIPAAPRQRTALRLRTFRPGVGQRTGSARRADPPRQHQAADAAGGRSTRSRPESDRGRSPGPGAEHGAGTGPGREPAAVCTRRPRRPRKARRRRRRRPRTQPSTPADVCVQWGPFSDADRAKAQADLEALKLGRQLSQHQVTVTDAWWVSLAPDADARAADRRVTELRALSIDDVSVVDSGDGQFAVSLGIFHTQNAATARVQALAARGVAGATAAPRQQAITQTMLVVRNPSPVVAAKLEELQGKYAGQRAQVRYLHPVTPVFASRRRRSGGHRVRTAPVRGIRGIAGRRPVFPGLRRGARRAAG